MVKELCLANVIYTDAAIRQTAADYENLCSVEIFPTSGGTRVRIYVADSNPLLVDEFLNYALGLSAEELLA